MIWCVIGYVIGVLLVGFSTGRGATRAMFGGCVVSAERLLEWEDSRHRALGTRVTFVQ